MSRRARRSASLTALTSRTRELPMMNGSPRPSAPAAAVVAASGRGEAAAEQEGEADDQAAHQQEGGAPEQERVLQLLVDQRRREGDFDGPVGPLAAADGGQNLLAVDIRVRTTLPGGSWASRGGTAVPTSRAWSRRRAMMTPLLSQMAADQPSGRPWLCSSARRSSGSEAEAHDEAHLVAAQDRDRDVVDRLPHHQAGEEIGDDGAGRLPHPLQRRGIARDRRRLAVGHVGVDDLAALGLDQHQIGPAAQAVLRLRVESRPILRRQQGGGRQRLQDGDPAIGVAVDVGDQGLQDLARCAG